MLKNQKLGFIGGGNMAEAIIKGLLAGGVPAADIQVAEPLEERRDYLSDRYGVAVESDNSRVTQQCSLIVLSVKPQIYANFLNEFAAGSNE